MSCVLSGRCQGYDISRVEPAPESNEGEEAEQGDAGQVDIYDKLVELSSRASYGHPNSPDEYEALMTFLLDAASLVTSLREELAQAERWAILEAKSRIAAKARLAEVEKVRDWARSQSESRATSLGEPDLDGEYAIAYQTAKIACGELADRLDRALSDSSKGGA